MLILLGPGDAPFDTLRLWLYRDRPSGQLISIIGGVACLIAFVFRLVSRMAIHYYGL